MAVTSIALVGAFIAYGAAASAAPDPTASQVRHRISRLMSQLDAVAQQYDQSITDLKAANARLAVLGRRLGQDQRKFEAMRAAVTQIASAAYMQGGLDSVSSLLASDDPQAVLDRAALLSHLSSDRRAQMDGFVAAARALRASQQAQQRATAAIAALKKNKAAQRQHLRQLIAKDQAKLNKLTPPSAPPASGGTTYTGPATGQARAAVQFAYAQLGKPYVWGATGPGSYDCSGLVQAAWAAAGVSIPRTTYEQWSALPHVSSSSLRPGDLMFYDAEGHVSMYVGGGYIIDAPQPGESVEKVDMSESWYAQNFDGAARP